MLLQCFRLVNINQLIIQFEGDKHYGEDAFDYLSHQREIRFDIRIEYFDKKISCIFVTPDRLRQELSNDTFWIEEGSLTIIVEETSKNNIIKVINELVTRGFFSRLFESEAWRAFESK